MDPNFFVKTPSGNALIAGGNNISIVMSTNLGDPFTTYTIDGSTFSGYWVLSGADITNTNTGKILTKSGSTLDDGNGGIEINYPIASTTTLGSALTIISNGDYNNYINFKDYAFDPAHLTWNVFGDGTSGNGSMIWAYALANTSAAFIIENASANQVFKVLPVNKQVLTLNNTLDDGSGGMSALTDFTLGAAVPNTSILTVHGTITSYGTITGNGLISINNPMSAQLYSGGQGFNLFNGVNSTYPFIVSVDSSNVTTFTLGAANTDIINMIGKVTKYNNITVTGLGLPPIYGVDNRSGLTAADASAITLYTTTAAGQMYRVVIRANATAFTSGMATYTFTWTENGVTQTRTAVVSALNTPAFSGTLIQPDNGTAMTVQLTGTFTATVSVGAAIEQIA